MRAVGSIGTRLTEEIVGLEKMAAVHLIDAFGFGGGGRARGVIVAQIGSLSMLVATLTPKWEKNPGKKSFV